jgi:YbgC/YbaW family acyl-CoA thioester hydrolase
MFTTEYLISEKDMEPRYNHVHHGHCLRILEGARVEYLTAIGQPFERLLDEGVFLVITNVQVRYLRELLLGNVRIECFNPRIEGRAMRIDQRIVNEKGKTCVEAQIEFMCMNPDTKRGFPVPEKLAEAFTKGA